MNIEDFKYLFTPITEKLPERTGAYDWIICITNHGSVVLRSIRLLKHKVYGDVTHWLDLSKLTTKERAERFAEFSFDAGMCWENDKIFKGDKNQFPFREEFINKNKAML